jgi:hypothetical protein
MNNASNTTQCNLRTRCNRLMGYSGLAIVIGAMTFFAGAFHPGR